MPKLSVIVPVYNTGKQLAKCLNSLKDLEDTEIIVINDGSKDNSEKVIYEHMQDNMKYYSKPNTGIADTRNFGIEHATGDYILFVDSDDYIERELLDKLNTYMRENIEVIKFKLQRVNEEGKILEKVDGSVFEKQTGEDAFSKLYSTDVLLDSPCVYLFKREYLLENNFKFKVGTYHEDFGLVPLIVIKAASVVSVDFYGYNYVQVEGSITRNKNYDKTVQKMKDAITQYDNMVAEIEHYPIGKTAKENIRIFYTNSIILKLKELKSEDQDFFIKEIKNRKMVQNIKIRNVKQLIKRIILSLNIKCYLKKRWKPCQR